MTISKFKARLTDTLFEKKAFLLVSLEVKGSKFPTLFIVLDYLICNVMDWCNCNYCMCDIYFYSFIFLIYNVN